ncbi:Tol-Pal system beta propeller repeat protein TolB [soil metagenome]
MRNLIRAIAAVAFAIGVGPLAAQQVRIDVTGVGAYQTPFAIVPFTGEADLPTNITEIVRADLQRSGLFKIVDAGTPRMDENTAPNFGDWKNKGADFIAAGSVARLPDGRLDVRVRLYDVNKQGSLLGFSNATPNTQLRLVGHRIADQIYEKITGDKGVFSTRIAYVLKRGTSYTLQVADADGFGPQAALTSNEPIISPSWSPDGERLAYVSFEQRKPVIYVHSLATGQRKQLASFRGSNSAPAWSSDGNRVAMTLTLSGMSQIYLLNADGSGQPQRISNSSSIDTEPVFSADGQSIYFTSDRGGAPQIYKMSASGGEVQRITFRSDYNVSPTVSPDGKSIAYIARRAGKFQVAVLDFASGAETVVNPTSTSDESPSFSPNSRYLLYATTSGGRDSLGVVSADGRIHQSLTFPAGDIREPAWGPYQ